MKYVQLIGTQRSGSNLFRLMVDQLDEIIAPHPPHILSTFFPILNKYGNLEKNKNVDRLISDVIEWVKSNPIKWNKFSVSSEDIKSKFKNPSIIQIFKAIYELYATQSNSMIWICKSLSNSNYYYKLEKEGLNPIYVYLYRDGRDVALSFKNTIIGPKHTYFIADQWLKDQIMCDRIKKQIPPSRFISIKYEVLLSNPHKVISDFCNKINVGYDKKVLNYYKSKESIIAASSGEMWSNLSKPLLINNKSKYIKGLNLNDKVIFESIAGSMLKKLNYKLYCKVKELISNFKSSKIDEFRKVDNQLRALVLDNANPRDLKLRIPHKKLLKKITNY